MIIAGTESKLQNIQKITDEIEIKYNVVTIEKMYLYTPTKEPFCQLQIGNVRKIFY